MTWDNGEALVGKSGWRGEFSLEDRCDGGVENGSGIGRRLPGNGS